MMKSDHYGTQVWESVLTEAYTKSEQSWLESTSQDVTPYFEEGNAEERVNIVF
jgi:hypothetical protein